MYVSTAARSFSAPGRRGGAATVVIDFVQFAIDDAYDQAMRVSSNADFVPAVKLLLNHGKRVSHVGFRNQGQEIRNPCWDHFCLEDLMAELLAP